MQSVPDGFGWVIQVDGHVRLQAGDPAARSDQPSHFGQYRFGIGDVYQHGPAWATSNEAGGSPVFLASAWMTSTFVSPCSATSSRAMAKWTGSTSSPVAPIRRFACRTDGILSKLPDRAGLTATRTKPENRGRVPSLWAGDPASSRRQS